MDSEQAGNGEIEALIRDYCAAWSERDATRRGEMLDRVWAVEGSYTDPTARVEGRAQLMAHIGVVLTDFFPPGARIVAVSPVDRHHDVFRFRWQAVQADGAVLLEGLDFGEIDESGRIRRIVGFFERP